MKPEYQKAVDDLLDLLASLYAQDVNLAMAAITEAKAHARRLKGRLEVPEGYQRVEFVQDRGPTVEFSGKLLAEHGKPGAETELWLTLSGDWVLWNAYQSRAYTFEGDERTPEDVAAATGYDHWVKPIFKKMGWKMQMDFD